MLTSILAVAATRTLRQFVEQGLGLLQVQGVKALGEPAVDRSEKIAGLVPLPPISPKPCHTHRCAQFIGLCLLLRCNVQRRFEGALALVKPVETEESDAFEAMKLRVPPTVACIILLLQPISRRGNRTSVGRVPLGGVVRLESAAREARSL